MVRTAAMVTAGVLGLLLSIAATIFGIPGLFPFSDWLIHSTDKLNFLTFSQ